MEQFIDKMLTEWYTERERNHFLARLGGRYAGRRPMGRRGATLEQQTEVLTALEEQAIVAQEALVAERAEPEDEEGAAELSEDTA